VVARSVDPGAMILGSGLDLWRWRGVGREFPAVVGMWEDRAERPTPLSQPLVTLTVSALDLLSALVVAPSLPYSVAARLPSSSGGRTPAHLQEPLRLLSPSNSQIESSSHGSICASRLGAKKTIASLCLRYSPGLADAILWIWIGTKETCTGRNRNFHGNRKQRKGYI
jgi:hypothetical protein